MNMDKSYIHLFNTVAEYEEARNNDYYEPWVSYTIETSGISFNKTKQEKLLEKPLTFNILSDGYFCFTFSNIGGGVENTKTIQYSINNGEWTNLTSNVNKEVSTAITVDGLSGTFIYGGYDEDVGNYYWEYNETKLYYWDLYVPVDEYVYDENEENEYKVLTSEGNFEGAKINVVTGDIVRFRGNNATYAELGQYDRKNRFETTCNFSIEGNIMSLVNSTGYKSETTLVSANTFNSLFNDCTGLTSAENLVLPATTLARQCYREMFEYCTSLTTAPALPATTLAYRCYESMFNGCTSLTTAPELPATTLAERCYCLMFEGCTSLTTPPELPATTLANECYFSMFDYCTSLASAPVLPSTTLTNECYLDMFGYCTSLTTAPELPATTLAYRCYSNMFEGCTSLTTAPELPATTLAEMCYEDMFLNCGGLNYIKCLATNISASDCTKRWADGVSSTGTFVKDASMTGWTTGNNGIPSNWTVQDAS